jgi:polysaccharide export outer membrane protein
MNLAGMKTMKLLAKLFRHGTALALFLALVWLNTGCGALEGTNPPVTNQINAGTTSDVLNVGDLVTVIFSDLPTPTTPFEERVKDDGTITLLHNQTFQVAGKSRRAVEQEIHDRYVPAYYVHLTATVKPQERFYYVGGEVKRPSRQPHPGEITVLKAIASAEGFTDFANKRKVRLTRANGRTVIVDCEAALENPQLDLPVYPGDNIVVPRSWL